MFDSTTIRATQLTCAAAISQAPRAADCGCVGADMDKRKRATAESGPPTWRSAYDERKGRGLIGQHLCAQAPFKPPQHSAPLHRSRPTAFAACLADLAAAFAATLAALATAFASFLAAASSMRARRRCLASSFSRRRSARIATRAALCLCQFGFPGARARARALHCLRRTVTKRLRIYSEILPWMPEA